jgi:multidrug efflux pump subunit AcrA (membrane-fusion protein)
MRLWINAALLAVFASSVLAVPSRAQPGGDFNVTTPVVVASVEQREVSAGRTFVGTVLPSRRSTVGSAVDERVIELLVNDGDWVREGEPLAKLRTTTVELELAAAKAELNLREYELTELKNGSRPEEIAQAKASRARAEAIYQYAKSRLERTEALYAKGNITSKEEMEEVRSAATAAQQSLLEAQAAYELATEGPRQEKILQAEARLEMQKAEVDRLEDHLGRFTIRAPYDSYVITEHTEVGQWISRSDPVVEVAAIDPVEITVAVPETYIASLRAGMSATVILGALGGKAYPATISRIVPQADVRSRSFPVKIELSNPRDDDGHELKAGMLAQVTLAVGRPQPALLVPKDALVLGGRNPLVYVVENDPKKRATVRAVPVQLGVADQGDIQVTGDLKAGQKVVVRGNERLRPGMQVMVVEDTET